MSDRYVPKHHYSWAEQVELYRLDLLADAESTEDQAYAAQCRQQAANQEPALIKALGYKRHPEIEKLFTAIRA